ncbi:hypothetical protein LMH73_016900 [Vibrio splendidus]|nr:hypothetical protein [Vibrio splendidus]MCC4881836.1 hypothetical protein [Vibrio splendidus]
MIFSIIDNVSKIVDVMVQNPQQFTFIVITAIVSNVVVLLAARKHYAKKIGKYATTIVALYDSEKVALELLKENEVERGNKNTLRSLAFETGGYSTQVYRSQVIKYAKKSEAE